MTPESYLPKSLDADSQYGQRFLNSADPHYVQKLMKSDYHAKMSENFQDYADGSETEEKHYGQDKYLFPYTGNTERQHNFMYVSLLKQMNVKCFDVCLFRGFR